LNVESAIKLLRQASRVVAADPNETDSDLAAWYARDAEEILDDPSAAEWPYIQRDIARVHSYFERRGIEPGVTE